MKNFWKMLLLAGVTAVMTLGAVSAQDAMSVEEYPIELEGGIKGIVVQPQTENKLPVVLMLHGFASQKDEVGDMYKRLAAALGAQGIASLRIDFRGWGESGGAMTDSTVVGMVEDAATAYAYLKTLDFVDPARIGVIGFSLGGRIAIVSGAQNPDWYQSMALWSTGGDIPADFLGQEALDTANRDGQATIDLGWREVTLGKGFFESLSAYRMEDEFVNYTDDLLVIAGSEDPDPAAYLDWYLDHAQGSMRSAYLVPGGDHIYAVLTDDQTMAERVIATTVTWFRMTL